MKILLFSTRFAICLHILNSLWITLKEQIKKKKGLDTLYHLCRTTRILLFRSHENSRCQSSFRCFGGCCYRRGGASVWERGLCCKSPSATSARCGLVGSFVCGTAGPFRSGEGSFTLSLSAALAGWLSCSIFSSSSPSSSFPFSSSLTLCTIKRCLLRDSADVKHRPQWRHWGVSSSVLCCGMCCWKCALSSVTKPHLEQRNWALGRFVDGAPRFRTRSSSRFCASGAARSDTNSCKWIDTQLIWHLGLAAFRSVPITLN